MEALKNHSKENRYKQTWKIEMNYNSKSKNTSSCTK